MPRKIVILIQGQTDPLNAKTAISLMRYCPEEVVAVLDTSHAGETAEPVFGVGGETPIVDTLAEAAEKYEADTLSIGIATAGGKLPEELMQPILQAIERGMRIESGLHKFLTDDPTLVSLAKQHGATLLDIRKNTEKEVSQRLNINPDCFRVHTVGHDCSVGKMVTSIEISRALNAKGLDSKFVATGQTGIMIEGDGCPIDCVVADFINGSAERLVLDNQHHDNIFVEGQGSLFNPRYSSVTLGLLHGCMPDALIMVYEAGRPHVLRMPHVGLPTMQEAIDVYETMANVMHPCKVIGIAMNTRLLNSDAEVEDERKRMEDAHGLPVSDVIRDGPGKLADVVMDYRANQWKK